MEKEEGSTRKKWSDGILDFLVVYIWYDLI